MPPPAAPISQQRIAELEAIERAVRAYLAADDMTPIEGDHLATLQTLMQSPSKTRIQAAVVKAYLLLVCNEGATHTYLARDVRETLSRSLLGAHPDAEPIDGEFDFPPEEAEARERLETLLGPHSGVNTLARAVEVIERLYGRLAEVREMGRKLATADYGLLVENHLTDGG